MTPPILNLFVNLEDEFNNVQKSLTDIDENIKKITGKDPRLFENNRNRYRTNLTEKKYGTKRKLFDSSDLEEDNFSKRSLQSQVVATSWEAKQRNQVLEEQKNDKKSMSRNKRMFGLILGTLEKFKNEESQRKDLQKRAEIEQKLDQVAEQEQEALKKEREILFNERKTKRIQMKCLKQKLERAQLHKEWEKSQQFVGNNAIETKTKPHIFYMPVKQNQETLRRFQETRDKYRIILAEKRAKVQKELNEIDELYKQEETQEEKNGHVPIENQENDKDKNNNNLEIENKKKSPEKQEAAIEKTSQVNEKTDKPQQHHHHHHHHHSSHRNSKSLKKPKETDEKIESELPSNEENKESLGDKDFEPIYD